ncbi:MAG: sulfatase-like hydrolase/transferase, partial [Firmicutes bacterium]|nr:sulfatase-like hydrolase/transferase [Bacillota bacterium]
MSINSRFGLGINKLLSVLMLAACLVFLFLQSREVQFSLTWYFVAVCAALVIVLIPWRCVGRPVKSERASEGSFLYGATAGKASGRRSASIAEKRALQIMFVLTPLAAYWITNKATDADTVEIFRKLFSLYGLLNIVIIVAVLFVFYVIFNRAKIAIVLTIVLAMVLGIVDYIMLLFRGSPLIAADIASAGTGMDVLSNYTMTFSSGALWIITASVIYISVAVSFKSSKGLGLKGRLVLAAVTVVCVGGLAGLFFFTGYLEDQGISVDGYRPDKSYEEYGTVLGFAATMTDTKMKEPEGYSKDAVEKIASEYPSDKASAGAVTSKKTPDIIVVMNESFSDLEALADIGTSEEYIPYFNSLRKNTIRGTLHTSVLGGGTSITEHEFLTGNTSAFLPLHKAIYNDGITGDSPSLASTLKEQGYGGNIAFHPGQADSYNRSNVYPHLGFDKFISVEDMKDPEKVRNYVSDKANYERVIAEYEKYKASKEKAPFFMFN